MNYHQKNKQIKELAKKYNKYIVRDKNQIVYAGIMFEYWGKFENKYLLNFCFYEKGCLIKTHRKEFKTLNDLIKIATKIVNSFVEFNELIIMTI